MSIVAKRLSEGAIKRDADYRATEFEIKYLVVFGPADEISVDNALAAVHNDASRPAKMDDLPYAGTEFNGFEGDGRVINVTALYKSQDGSVSTDQSTETFAVMGFDASTSSKKTIRALAQEVISGGSDGFGSVGLSIGWNGKKGADAAYDGIDLLEGVMRETWTVSMPRKAMTPAFKRTVGSMLRTVNKTSFKGWAPGEALFVAASYSSPLNAQRITVTFHFAIQPNEAGVVIGKDKENEDIKVPMKKGWQYIWAIPGQQIVEESYRNYVAASFLSTVYRESDFSALGIPGETITL